MRSASASHGWGIVGRGAFLLIASVGFPLGAASAAVASPSGPAAVASSDQYPDPFPTFHGMTIPEATTSAAALGLRLETTMTVFPGRPGRIYTQYPRPFTSPSQDFDGTVYVSVANGLLASGRSATEFRTTGGAAYCQVAGTWPVLTCWTPKSGRMVTVGAGDIAKPSMRFHRLAIGARPKGLRTVGYGASWVWRKADETGRRRIVLRCYSDRRALTCENDYRSGFRLARNGTYGSWAKTEV